MAYQHTLLGKRITWTDGETDRTGEVWSVGPVTGTAWVIPDERAEGEGIAVCVRVARCGHDVREIDRRRSTDKMQDHALAALRCRMILPALLFPGAARLGSFGYQLPRGA